MFLVWTLAVLCGVAAATAGHQPEAEDEKLPPVAEMLNASSHTLQRIHTQVSKMSSDLGSFANKQQQALSELKTHYEQQLTSEQAETRRLSSVNERITTEIWQLEKGNVKLRQQATQLEADNQALRKAFRTVKGKLGAASSYVNSSLSATDDQDASVLEVLAKDAKPQVDAEETSVDADAGTNTSTSSDAEVDTTEADAGQDVSSESSVQDGDSDGAGDAGDAPDSFISLRARHRALRGRFAVKRYAKDAKDADADTDEDGSDSDANADDTADVQAGEEDGAGDDATQTQNATRPNDRESQNLVQSLSKELQQLEEQDAESRQRMDKLFQREWKEGKKEQAKVISKQQALNSTRTSLMVTQHELQEAVGHLETTKGDLQRRLGGLGRYLQRLASFAVKPAADAERLIPSLPGSVGAFLQRERHAERPPMTLRPAPAH